MKDMTMEEANEFLNSESKKPEAEAERRRLLTLAIEIIRGNHKSSKAYEFIMKDVAFLMALDSVFSMALTLEVDPEKGGSTIGTVVAVVVAALEDE